MMPYVLGDDRPKDNPWQDDRLGYANFAKRIFNVVANNRAPNGYVIGLHGQWGSGKSTILNFVKAYLAKHNEEAPEHRVDLIEFQPWIVSGHQDLIVTYFKLLSEALGPKENRWVRSFRKAVRIGYGATDKLIDAAATVALTVDPTGTAGGIAGSVAKKSIEGFVGRFLEDKSLQQAYDNLREQLKLSGRRFVVTIDDIDRLDDDEVRLIMQMVKTVGRLPNVVYLLAYDRSIVGKILDRSVAEGEPRFVEKIVQQEIALPPPGQNTLLTMLDGEISFLEAAIPENDRWGYLLRSGIHRWIRRPRDVLRLSNAVKWAWPALEGNFDGADLLTMEGIKLFEPILFSWIELNRNFLFNEGEYIMGADEKRKATVSALKSAIPAGSVEPNMSLLAMLFPDHSRWFEGAFAFHHEEHADAYNRRGMASKAHYDSYFSLQLSDDAIPKTTIAQILTGSDPAEIEGAIRPYLSGKASDGTERISLLMREIRYRLEEKEGHAVGVSLLDALLSVGEQVQAMPWATGMFSATPGAEYNWVLKDLLKKWGEGVADQNLLDVVNRCNSIASIANLFVLVGRSKKVFGKDGEGLEFITDEAFQAIGEILLERIRSASRDGTLAEVEVFSDVLRSWKRLSGAEEPRAWILANLGLDGARTARIARSIIGESYSSDTGHKFRMYRTVDREIFDIEAMINAARGHIEQSQVSANERAILDEILRAGPIVLSGESVDDLD